MSEEEKNENKCFCQSKGFRKFLVIALGSFVGVYSALCLFTALHRPPMLPPCPMGYGSPVPIVRPCPYAGAHHFNKGFRPEKGDFHKAIKEHRGMVPFEHNRERADKD